MGRAFVSQFLLPLVRGGHLAVGRPLSRRMVERLARAHDERGGVLERAAAVELARSRQTIAASLTPSPTAPALDEATWRLGAAVHNLIALGHPQMARGPAASFRLEHIARAAEEMAALGAPATATQAIARHTLLARLTEVVRPDSTVTYWLGRITYVGRPPPARVLAMPQLRGVRVETVRRSWLRDVGVPVVGRSAFAALIEASPLGEALDPLRLEPPLLWGRMLTVLRFPALCRAVASRIVTLGVRRCGDVLVDALFRFAALQDPPAPVRASPDAIAFAIRFLAHLVWLEHLFGNANPDTDAGEAAGHALAVLLAAAGRVQPSLLLPKDVPATSDIAQRFSRHLRDLFERQSVYQSPRWSASSELVELATAPTTLARPA